MKILQKDVKKAKIYIKLCKIILNIECLLLFFSQNTLKVKHKNKNLTTKDNTLIDEVFR